MEPPRHGTPSADSDVPRPAAARMRLRDRILGGRSRGELHGDPGLQPERTSLSWNRTMLALVVAGMLFLRWVPHHGWFPLVLTALTIAAACAIAVSQSYRYRRGVRGIRTGGVTADVAAVGWTATTVVLVAALALFVVVALPLP